MPRRLTEDETRPVMLGVGLEPLEPYPGGHTPWKCKCLVCGAIVKAYFSATKHRGSACDLCAQKVRTAKQTLPLSEAIERMRKAGVEPIGDYNGYLNPWKCKCMTCGTIVNPRLNNVSKGQGACKHCAGKWDDEDNVAFVKEKGFEPLEPYPGAHKPWKMRCTVCEVIVYPHMNRLKNDGGGCRSCDGQIVTNEQATEVMRSAGLEPIGEYVNAKAKWSCKCMTCGKIVTTSYGNVFSGRGCRFCAVGAFKRDKPALLYFLTYPKFSALKIGITGVDAKPNRLKEHEKNGWTVIKTWQFDIGADAEELEGDVLSWWRNELEAPPSMEGKDMPQHGKTETVSSDLVDISETIEFVERLIQTSVNTQGL